MESRISAPLILIVLCILPFSLKAQDYREAQHACFKLEEERAISLEGSEFTTRAEWSDKQVFASIPSLPVPCSLIINGFPLGLLEPGRISPVEYNITPFLKKEFNTLELVPADSSAFDAPLPLCSLLVRDAIHIRDMIVTDHPGLSADENLVRVQLYIKNYRRQANRERNILLVLKDPEGKSLIQESRVLGSGLSYGQETEMDFDLVLENAATWLPGKPKLYEIFLSLGVTDAEKPELVTTHFAMTSFWHNDSLLVQGEDSMMLCYPSEDQSRILPTLKEEEILEMMQTSGINALRTDTPLPCKLEALLQKCGILVVKD